MARNASKRRVSACDTDAARPSKQRKLTAKGTKSQPVVVDDKQPNSPREVLVIASQADDFESQLRDSRSTAAPIEASEIAIVASTAAEEEEEDEEEKDGEEKERVVEGDGQVYKRFADNFDGMDCSRLKGFIRPLRTPAQRKS